jgi:hypothetical protein
MPYGSYGDYNPALTYDNNVGGGNSTWANVTQLAGTIFAGIGGIISVRAAADIARAQQNTAALRSIQQPTVVRQQSALSSNALIWIVVAIAIAGLLFAVAVRK